MKLKQTESKKLFRAYDVTVPANDIATQIDAQLIRISKTLKMPGFRKGKVPMNLVKKQHGQNVLGDVLQKLVERTSQEALKQEKLRPAYQPKIEVKEFEEGKDLTYSMELEVLPDMPTIKPEDITIERPKVELTDEEVLESIATIAERAKDFEPVEKPRAAKNGDAVLIDFKGFVGDEAFAGGEAQGHQLELGSGQFIPGFEEQLVGQKVGAKLDVNVTFPEAYHSEDLAGKEARFEVTVHDVLEAKPAKVDDALATKLGLKDLDSLKDVIRSQMEMEVSQAVRFHAKKALFDELDTLCQFDTPTEMEKREFDTIWQQMERHKAQNPEDPELNKSEKELKKEYEEMANRRVRLGIFLTELGAKEKIQVTPQELQQAAMQEARNYQGQEQQVLEFFKNNPQQLETLRGPILEEKVVDMLLEKVNTKDVKQTLKDLTEDTTDEAMTKKTAAKKKSAAAKKPAAKKTAAKKPAAKKKPAAAKKDA